MPTCPVCHQASVPLGGALKIPLTTTKVVCENCGAQLRPRPIFNLLVVAPWIGYLIAKEHYGWVMPTWQFEAIQQTLTLIFGLILWSFFVRFSQVPAAHVERT